jgi:hypothetical protein
MVMVMKSSISWDIMPFSLLKVKSYACCLLHIAFLIGLFFGPEDLVGCCSEMLVYFQQTV